MAVEVTWHVGCERCNWHDSSALNREAAVNLGQAHSDERHPDEYRFRVQKVVRR